LALTDTTLLLKRFFNIRSLPRFANRPELGFRERRCCLFGIAALALGEGHKGSYYTPEPGAKLGRKSRPLFASVPFNATAAAACEMEWNTARGPLKRIFSYVLAE